MMTAAAFQACYAEWKVIKTRATVQIVFELPIERADEAYQALGGMPIAAHEVWCGIARLNPSKEVMPDNPQYQPPETQPRPVTDRQASPAGADKPRKSFDEISPAQQAGILCNEVPFWTFLGTEHPSIWRRCDGDGVRGADVAAAVVRELVGVNSRAEIKPDNAKWSALVLAYRLWMRHPELSPA